MESFLWLKSVTEPGFRRSPGEVFLQLKSSAKSDSRRSPDGAYPQLKSVTEPGSRRSPGRVLLAVEVGDGAWLPWEFGWSIPAVDVRCEVRLP